MDTHHVAVFQESRTAHDSCVAAQTALQQERDQQISARQELNRLSDAHCALDRGGTNCSKATIHLEQNVDKIRVHT